MKNILLMILVCVSLTVSATGKWKTLRLDEEGSPKNDIVALAFDKSGALWAGTSFGVYRQVATDWQLQGTENIYVQSLYIDRNDTKWVGLWAGGLWRCCTGGSWEKLEKATSTGCINTINGDQQGNIWIGDWGGGLTQIASEGENLTTYKADKVALGDNSVNAVAQDTKGKMWFGCYHGVSSLDQGKWTLFNKSNSRLPNDDVYALAAAPDGSLWIGTCNGLACLKEGKWSVFTTANSALPCNLILSLAVDKQGCLWVGTPNGVARFDGKKWTVYNQQNSPLPNDRIQCITIKGSAVYLGTSKGIAVFTEQ